MRCTGCKEPLPESPYRRAGVKYPCCGALPCQNAVSLASKRARGLTSPPRGRPEGCTCKQRARLLQKVGCCYVCAKAKRGRA